MDIKPLDFKKFTFDEAIQFIKNNPERFRDDDLGLYVLKLIREGNSRKLKRWWLGVR